MAVGGAEAEACCGPYRPPAKSEGDGVDGTVTDDGPAAAWGPDCVIGICGWLWWHAVISP